MNNRVISYGAGLVTGLFVSLLMYIGTEGIKRPEFTKAEACEQATAVLGLTFQYNPIMKRCTVISQWGPMPLLQYLGELKYYAEKWEAECKPVCEHDEIVKGIFGDEQIKTP